MKTSDILDFLGKSNKSRPKLVVGFSAETENLIQNSVEKSKLDNLFQKNLEDAKDALKKAGSN